MQASLLNNFAAGARVGILAAPSDVKVLKFL